MKKTRKLIFSVTNDLTYDQRMIRICSSLANAGFDVTLAGRKLPSSIPLRPMPYRQFRIRCFFTKGFIFYTEFNIRLFFYLIYKKADLVCAIDLDTILPVYTASVIKNIPRVYDAHELFTEMKEIVTRPRIHRFWKAIEKWAVPRFKLGYTVSNQIADDLKALYGVKYETIRNLPVPIALLSTIPHHHPQFGHYILYQGAVNEGRCFETLIPAMQAIDTSLVICGDGNFMQQAKRMVKDHNLGHKVFFTGWVEPEKLRQFTLNATVGLNIIEHTGLNQQHSLANRFFDYIQCAVPQVCIDYPAYRQVNDQFHCALMIADTRSESIAKAVNTLLTNTQLHSDLRNNCMRARTLLNWNMEETKLTEFYNNIFANIG